MDKPELKFLAHYRSIGHIRLSPQPSAAVVFQAFWFSLLGAQGTGARRFGLYLRKLYACAAFKFDRFHSGAVMNHFFK